MRKFKNLYTRINDFDNILSASKKARRSKRYKNSTAEFEFNLENNLINIQNELKNKTYKFGEYREFMIKDPKERIIAAAPYRDRVVHHAVMNIIEPLFDKTFIYDSYACRVGKGTHRALDRCQDFLRKNKYVLKLDIWKYFFTIDHHILYDILKKKIRDNDLLWLLKEIIDSTITGKDYYCRFTGDDLFSILRPRGIPIGNLTSQFFANLYLNELDYFLKFNYRIKYYIRYMDDMLIFSDSKELLHEIKKNIEKFLVTLRLILHPKKVIISPYKEGVNFLGFRIFRNYRKLLGENVKRFKKRFKNQIMMYNEGTIDFETMSRSVRCWISHAEYGNTYNLRKKIFNTIMIR